jgi:hypothetical protein
MLTIILNGILGGLIGGAATAYIFDSFLKD